MALFSEQEQQQIRKAIEDAEARTSGEIRICVEKNCRGEVLDRAADYFHKLGMSQTSLHNGVLIYLATEDHKFAIIGDSGINNVVPENFWNDTKEHMLQYFKQDKLAEGIITGIKLAGEKLKAYFPYQDGDKNELSDDIAFF